jgi:hypothetical protein
LQEINASQAADLHIISLIISRWILKSPHNEVLNPSPSNHDAYANAAT